MRFFRRSILHSKQARVAPFPYHRVASQEMLGGSMTALPVIETQARARTHPCVCAFSDSSALLWPLLSFAGF
eukprot:1989188-Pleurochrysis_carterae.AAC.1